MIQKTLQILRSVIVSTGVLSIFLLFISCDFAFKEHVIGKYYIIGVDTKDDLSLSYDLNNGAFLGKAPSRIIEYGYNDTFIVAKVLEDDAINPTYYIIDMTKDNEYALEENYRVGPVTESEYASNWMQKLKGISKNPSKM